VAAVSVAAITGVNYGLREIAPAVSTGVVYLLAVLLVSSYWGLWLGLVTPKPAGSGLTKARSPKPAPQEPICGPPSGLHDRTDGRNRRNFGRGAPQALTFMRRPKRRFLSVLGTGFARTARARLGFEPETFGSVGVRSGGRHSDGRPAPGRNLRGDIRYVPGNAEEEG
jgi:hypothetical protein